MRMKNTESYFYYISSKMNISSNSSNSLQVRQNSDAVNYVHRIKDMKDERISVF